MRPFGALIAAALLSACATSPVGQAPVPEAGSAGRSTAAIYDVQTGDGDWNHVTVRLWQEGLSATPPADAGTQAPPGPYARIAVEIQNDWTRSVDMPLSEFRLMAHGKRGESAGNAPLPLISTVTAASGEERTAHLYVPLGGQTRDVDSYEIRWVLRSGDRVYRQETPFVRATEAEGGYTPFGGPVMSGGVSATRSSSGWHSGVSFGIGISN